MPSTKYNRDGKLVKNAVRIHSNTDSSARKYTAKDSVENNPIGATTSLSNLDHIINFGAGLKITAIAADKAAEIGRKSLDATREQLDASVSQGTPDARSSIKNFSDLDAQQSQDAFTSAIIDGIGPIDPKVDSRVGRCVRGIVGSGVSRFLPRIDTGEAKSAQNNAYPEIDHILVDIDKKKGTVDAFFASITFSLPVSIVSSGNIKSIRIMRASVTNPDLLRRVNFMSFTGLDTLKSTTNRTRSKNSDHVSALDIRLQEGSTPSALSFLNPVDNNTNSRIGSNSASDNLSSPVTNSKKLSPKPVEKNIESFLDINLFREMDRSVSLDLNTLRNIRLQNPDLAPPLAIDKSQQIGGDGSLHERMGPEHVRQSRERGAGQTTLAVVKNNQQEFQEVANFSPDKLKGRMIGKEFLQYSFEDPSIIFGRVYRYYISTIDSEMREGLRSKIVEVQTDGLRIPASPSDVTATLVNKFVALTINVDDQLVERFEIYRKEVDPGHIKTTESEIRIVNGPGGYTSELSTRSRMQNGFIQLGEVMNSSKGAGATYYDRDVQAGLSYTYRIYSVDIFGNKSESPYIFDFFVQDRQHKTTDLVKPNMLAEVDAFTGNIKLTFKCDDARVGWLYLGRRDLTLHQNAFVPPQEVSHVLLGAGTGLYSVSGTDRGTVGNLSFLDSVLSDRNRYVLDDRNGAASWVGWTGIFENSQTDIQFIDRSTRIDHTYQYQLYGVDKFGNKTPHETSPATFVFSKPLVNPPKNFAASVGIDSSKNVTGVNLSWQDGTVNFLVDDLIGNQTTLSDSSVRSLFQIQRRRVGEERWLDFPMVSGTNFFDPATISGSTAPGFRPPFVDVGQTYIYRVQTFQTGTFISNFTSPLQVFVERPIIAPANFTAAPADSKVRPYYIMLSWDTDQSSGVVDRWEIERCGVNNASADRLNISNPADFASLQFESFRTVYRESSRFQSRTLDEQNLPSPFKSEHGFMDMKVLFGNTYFYRIRAIGIDGTISTWSMKGAKVTDEGFEKKVNSITTPQERNALIATLDSSFVKIDLLEHPTLSNMKTFGIVSNFANPSKASVVAKRASSPAPTRAPPSSPPQKTPTKIIPQKNIPKF